MSFQRGPLERPRRINLTIRLDAYVQSRHAERLGLPAGSEMLMIPVEFFRTEREEEQWLSKEATARLGFVHAEESSG